MKILLFFHGGSSNRGAEAIIRTAVAMIEKQFPNATIGLSTSSITPLDKAIKEIDNYHLYERKTVKKYSFNWLISALKYKFFKDDSYAYRIIDKDLYDLIPQYDLFLSTGGDNYCYGEQAGFYHFDKAIKKANKKLVLWGASIGKEDLSVAKISDLSDFDLLLIRESYSFNILTDAGLDNVVQIADGAFLLEKEELPLPKEWRSDNIIGFNYSPLVWKKNPASKQAIIALLNYILAHTSFTIALTPHVIQHGNNDYEILQEIYSLFDEKERFILLPDSLNAMQYKGYIARMKFFVGARTHATIAAYSSFVPTMVLGYSVKSKGIAFDLFGEEKLVLDLEELADASKLITKFNELVADEFEIKQQLKERIPVLQAKAKEAGKLIKAL